MAKKITANEVKALRKKLGMSQNEFARSLNVSIKTVQAWEQEINTPGGSALRLMELFGSDRTIAARCFNY